MPSQSSTDAYSVRSTLLWKGLYQRKTEGNIYTALKVSPDCVAQRVGHLPDTSLFAQLSLRLKVSCHLCQCF